MSGRGWRFGLAGSIQHHASAAVISANGMLL
jgi:hypothetical protein